MLSRALTPAQRETFSKDESNNKKENSIQKSGCSTRFGIFSGLELHEASICCYDGSPTCTIETELIVK